MPQLNFEFSVNQIKQANRVVTAGSMSYFGMNFRDSISLNTLNILLSPGATAARLSLSFGLYSLTNSSLSLANSGSWTTSNRSDMMYGSIGTFSQTQNITPGTWFWGILASTNTSSNFSIMKYTVPIAGNAFPGGFIGGWGTVTTNALPLSEAISDLDITGGLELEVPIIIISS